MCIRDRFKDYARKIVENAAAMADELTARGVKLVSGGTDNHLLLVDLTDSEMTGKELEHNLDEVHITANKNTVPGEKRSPFVTSGVRPVSYTHLDVYKRQVLDHPDLAGTRREELSYL